MTFLRRKIPQRKEPKTQSCFGTPPGMFLEDKIDALEAEKQTLLRLLDAKDMQLRSLLANDVRFRLFARKVSEFALADNNHELHILARKALMPVEDADFDPRRHPTYTAAVGADAGKNESGQGSDPAEVRDNGRAVL